MPLIQTRAASDGLGTHWPPFLVDLVPGAPAARDAIPAALAKVHETNRANRRAGAALSAMQIKGERKAGVSASAYAKAQDEAALAVEAARNAYRAHDRAVQAYDRIMLSRIVDDDTLRRAAAQAAVDLAPQVAEAWATLGRLLTERDEASSYAGSPGRDWQAAIPGFGPVGSRFATARDVFEHAVARFDVDAHQRVADGEDVPNLDEPTPDPEPSRTTTRDRS